MAYYRLSFQLFNSAATGYIKQHLIFRNAIRIHLVKNPLITRGERR